MCGRNHIVVNSMAGLSCTAVVLSFGKGFPAITNDEVRSVMTDVCHYLFPDKGGWILFYIAFYVLLYLAGSLFPDVDSPQSFFGKHVRFPGRHRTWTHSIWIILIFCLGGMYVYWVWYFAFGYFLHVFGDSFSYGGVCWFYPFSQYRVYPSGAMIKRGRHLRCYRVGRPSEGIFVAVVCLICLLPVIYMIYNGGLQRIGGWFL